MLKDPSGSSGSRDVVANAHEESPARRQPERPELVEPEYRAIQIATAYLIIDAASRMKHTNFVPHQRQDGVNVLLDWSGQRTMASL
jgi:hypothetical protein